MIKELSFAWYCIKKNFQSSTELRTSFAMNVLGMMINNISFLVIWMCFTQAVGNVGGWSAYDMIGLFGFNATCYGITYSLFGGIRLLPEYVAGGAFDRYLLSPKNVLLRTATSKLTVSGFGDLFFGLICAVLYVCIMHMAFPRILLMSMVACIVQLAFFAVAIVSASVAFFLTDATMTSRSIFELFFTPSMFDGGAFQGVTRLFFIFIIPSLVLAALPVEIVRDMDFGKLVLVLLLSLGWFAFSIFLFYRGIRRYESSSLMGYVDL